MFKLFRPVVAAALFAFAGAPAFAADYVEPAPLPEPLPAYGGWYLRGDIGYNFNTEADGAFTFNTFDPVTATYGVDQFATASLDDTFTYSLGAGYNFTDWLRADLTFDYFTLGFDGTTASALPCSTSPFYVGTSCRSTDDADGYALSFLANGYVDLGTYVGLTPYVGAGLGYTYVDWDTMSDTTYCVGAACPGNSALFAQTTHDGDDSWRFTYALMAGMAYDLTNELKLDVGYRYRHIDGGDMFAFDPGSIANGAGGVQGEDPGIDTHEVRVGLRYALW